jgi:hypothetical protein
MEVPEYTASGKNTPTEQRSFPRRNIRLEVRCQILKRGEVSEPLPQETLELGTRGADLIGLQPFENGVMLMLSFFLPPMAMLKMQKPDEFYPSRDCQMVAILSRVTACEPLDNRFRYSVQFLDLERDHRMRFKRFLVELGLDQLTSPLYT